MKSRYIDISYGDALDPLYKEKKELLHLMDQQIETMESRKKSYKGLLAKQNDIYDTLLRVKNTDEKKLEELRHHTEAAMLEGEQLSGSLIQIEKDIYSMKELIRKFN